MNFTVWLLIIGAIFIAMALAASVLKRLPLSTSMLYLAVGFGLGPFGLKFIRFDPFEHAAILERVTEVAILISLFSTGLKLRTPLTNGRWQLPVRLAFVSMAITVGLIALVGVLLLNLSWGAAILLGAILAPTDPVLASDVQVENALDRDKLRFGLTGEAGLNDGSAFPFVMLGLGLLNLHEIGDFGWRWLLVDVIWSFAGGIAIGALLGTLIGRLVIYLRRQHREGVGLDDFLTLGLIALSYAVPVLMGTSGFLAVFAAGLALRRIERSNTGEKPVEEVLAQARMGEKEKLAVDPEKAPAYMAEAMLEFNEQLGRICEVGVVILLGGLLGSSFFMPETLWFIPLLFLVIRPISVGLGLLRTSGTSRLQRYLIAWFGVRGIGSLYYLMYAIGHGIAPGLARQLIDLTFSVVTVSIIVHGISVTPLMSFYGNRRQRRTVLANSPE